MSGLEIVGAISGIANLAAIVFQLSKTLYEVGGSLSSASSDIRDLARDLETFSEELHLLASLFDGDSNRYSARINNLVTKIIGDCAVMCNTITKILDKVQNGGLRAKLQWVFKEKEIMRLLVRLRDLRLSLMGMLGMLGALKADHLMDVEEGENHDGAEDNISISQDSNPSQRPLFTSSSRMESSPQNQVSNDGENPEINTSYIPIRSLPDATPGHTNLGHPTPSTFDLSFLVNNNGLAQLTEAMESNESFYSAQSSGDTAQEEEEHPVGPVYSAEHSRVIQQKRHARWKSDLITATMKHYKVGHNTAKEVVAKFPKPSFELQNNQDPRNPALWQHSRYNMPIQVQPQGLLRQNSSTSPQVHTLLSSIDLRSIHSRPFGFDSTYAIPQSQLPNAYPQSMDWQLSNISPLPELVLGCSHIQLSPCQLSHIWWRAYNILQISRDAQFDGISDCWNRNLMQCRFEALIRMSAPSDEVIYLNARLLFMSHIYTNIPIETLSKLVIESYLQIQNVYETI